MARVSSRPLLVSRVVANTTAAGAAGAGHVFTASQSSLTSPLFLAPARRAPDGADGPLLQLERNDILFSLDLSTCLRLSGWPLPSKTKSVPTVARNKGWSNSRKSLKVFSSMSTSVHFISQKSIIEVVNAGWSRCCLTVRPSEILSADSGPSSPRMEAEGRVLP